MTSIHTRLLQRDMVREHCKTSNKSGPANLRHMAELCARVHAARDWHKAHLHRCTLIERQRSQTSKGLSDSKLAATPLMSVGVVHAGDLGAAKASYLSRPPASRDGRPSSSPDGRTRRSDQTPTTSPQESQSPAKSTPAPDHSPSSSSTMVGAARTKPLKKPQAKKRAGAKATKQMERLKVLSLSRPKPQCSVRCPLEQMT